jgi:hypothetical protein
MDRGPLDPSKFVSIDLWLRVANTATHIGDPATTEMCMQYLEQKFPKLETFEELEE